MLDRPRALEGSTRPEDAPGRRGEAVPSGECAVPVPENSAAGREADPDPWADAMLAIRLIVVAGPMLGGIRLRARAGPVRELWLERLQAAMPQSVPFLRITPAIAPDRLAGGIDFAATLAAGRTIEAQGILQQARGGVVVLAMAERAAPTLAGVLSSALDRCEPRSNRESPRAGFALVALDEGIDEEGLLPQLAERLAITVDLTSVPWHRARAAVLPSMGRTCGGPSEVRFSDDLAAAIAAISGAVDGSLRRALFVARVARCLAAVDGRDVLQGEDVRTAFRLVFGLFHPATEEEPDAAGSTDEHHLDVPPEQDAVADGMRDIAVDIVRAAGLGDLVSIMRSSRERRARGGQAGGNGEGRVKALRGRPAGLAERPPVPGARLDAAATLRAAIPWQTIRRAGSGSAPAICTGGPLIIRKSDFRYIRHRQLCEPVVIFTVDASGSTALERLGEAKGAVECLLADCYVKRAHAALIAFRGKAADVLLEPTRSLARTKRALSALPGGGPTPLAAGMARALAMGEAVRRKGQSPLIVLLTDGRGNVALDGSAGRLAAMRDCGVVADRLAASGLRIMVIDIAARARHTFDLAVRMRADYHRLPIGDARRVSTVVAAAIGTE